MAKGIAVKLLPPAYVRAYLRRNKTDSADAAALLEASRCSDMHPVPVKSVEQQALQGLHRIRSLWNKGGIKGSDTEVSPRITVNVFEH